MSAIPKMLKRGRTGQIGDAGARGRDLAGDGRPPAQLREFDTPPSNTGVNNGLPYSGTDRHGQSGLSRVVKLPKKPTAKNAKGRFEIDSPENNLEVFKGVLEFQHACEKVLQLLSGIATPDDKATEFVGGYIQLLIRVLADHTHVTDRGIPKEKRERS